MKRLGRTALLTVAVLSLVLGSTASAHAATVQMTGGGLVIDSTGDGDAQGSFSIEPDARTPTGEISRWLVLATNCNPTLLSGTCLSPQGAGCKEPGPGDPGFGTPIGSEVRCDRSAAGVTVLAGGGDDTVSPVTETDPVTVDLGAGNDQLQSHWFDVANATGHWNVTGGSGNDTIQGSAGGNTIDGGPGNDNIKGFPSEPGINFPGHKGAISDRPEASAGDSIFGGPGNDVINAGFGADAVSGGDGNDRFNANDLSTAVSATDFDLRAPDAYDGGAGFDTIDYSQRTSDLFFDSGSVKSGATAAGETDQVSRTERAILGSGDDTALSLLDTLSSREYDGNAGDDVLNGIDGSDDTLDGGTGADKMNGFGGDDTIRANDGVADRTISCGSGTDSAALDLKDPNPIDASQCELITREAVKEKPVVLIASARVGRSGLRVHLSCPRRNDRTCRGRLDAAGRSSRYSIRRGRSGNVALAAHPRRGARLRVRSVERGRFGNKTVLRTLRVR